MNQERRDLMSRAETLRRLTVWISRAAAPVSGVPLSIAAPETGRRILKLLALRGLVRHQADGWMPQPPLLEPGVLMEDK
jgi:hypothetical protein